jgi:hypothetical protein
MADTHETKTPVYAYVTISSTRLERLIDFYTRLKRLEVTFRGGRLRSRLKATSHSPLGSPFNASPTSPKQWCTWAFTWQTSTWPGLRCSDSAVGWATTMRRLDQFGVMHAIPTPTCSVL